MIGVPAVAPGRRPPPLTLHDALFVDIDGTLVDLAPSPDRVDIDPALRTMLVSVAAALDGAMALITGRSIRDVDGLFPGLALPIAGQHGCERRSGDGTLYLHASDAKTYDRLRNLITRFAVRHPGLMVEHKGASLALHYRAAPELESLVQQSVAEVVDAVDGQWTVERGKCLLEVRPGGPDKGRAIAEFVREPPFAGRRVVFAGDDVGDEAGFRFVDKVGGVAVKVGSGMTFARYRLPDVEAVRAWIAALVPPAGA